MIVSRGAAPVLWCLGLVAFGATEARAETTDSTPAERAAGGRAVGNAAALATAQLELGLGVGRRSDRLSTAAVRSSAEGGALSDLDLAGVWFGARTHLGLLGRLGLERFALQARQGDPAQRAEVVGAIAEVGLLWRGSAWQRRLGFELGAAYGLLRLPVARIDLGGAEPALAGASLDGHGPALLAAVATDPDGPFGVELGAEIRPIAFGADYLGAQIRPARAQARLALRFGQWRMGAARWSGLLMAGISGARARSEGIHIEQTGQHLGLGLRARWKPAAVLRTAPRPPGSVTVSGLVRSEQGNPIAARIGVTELGLAHRADAAGRFRFDLPPGQYTLVIEAPGFVPQTMRFAAGADEQRIFNIHLLGKTP